MNNMRQCKSFPLKTVSFNWGWKQKVHRNFKTFEKSWLRIERREKYCFSIYFQAFLVMKTSFKSFPLVVMK